MSVNHNSRVLELELSVVQLLCREIDTPRALTVSLLVRHSQWDELLALTIDWRNYDDYRRFSDDYLVTSILQKNPRLPTGINKQEVAISKFFASEAVCKDTNARLLRFAETQECPEPDLVPILLRIQDEITAIIGPFPTKRDLAYCEQNMRFGPGATTSLSGIVTQGKKYSPRTPEVTSRLLPFRTFCFPDLWKQSVRDIRVSDFSKLTTVPKNAKTDRVICIEPDLNIFVQLGIGAVIRHKLLRSGLDLSSQEVNQDLARRASTESLVTIDLSAASDSISRELIWTLVPWAWADLLHFARVDKTRVNGEVVELEKWSSMGNGYTFELETLIFLATCRAVCKFLGLSTDKVSVYGDDIIVPVDAEEVLVRTLNFLGFSVNREKSFGKGRFHESCGADFFDGQNVRPIYFRSEHHDFETICYLYANSLRRWAHRRNNGESCDVRLLPGWLRCFSAVKPHLRFLIPEGFGDVGFTADFDRARPSINRELKARGWSGYNFRYRSCRAVERVISDEGSYLYALHRGGTEFRSGTESLRGRFRPATTKSGYVLTWPSLGPWSDAHRYYRLVSSY